MRGIPDAEFKPEARGLTGHPAHWPRLLRVLQFAPLVFVIVALSGLGVPRALTKAEGGDAHQTVPGATPLAEAGRAISTGTKDEILPAVAYGVQSDEYLVVWEQEHALTDHQVIGQRLGGDGILRGDPILITPFGDMDSKPAVAYHPTADEYLVVYQRKCYDDIWVSTDLYGQRIAADGLLTGAPISISGLTIPDEAEPRVAAFTGSQGGHLVAWEVCTGSLNSRVQATCSIKARWIGVDGSLPGDVLSVGEGQMPAVACGDQCLVVWEGVHEGRTDDDTMAATVGRDGSTGTPYGIETWEEDQIRPRIAHNGQANEYLVVWEDHHQGSGTDWDIRGRRLNSVGAVVAPGFDISWEGTDHCEAPDVAYSPALDEYLVVWEVDTLLGNGDVAYRRVGSDGTLPGAEMTVTSGESPERVPVLASDGGQTYLVAWEDEREYEQNGVDIYGIPVTIPLFSGYVYEGQVGDESLPLAGVNVELYCAGNEHEAGTLLATTTSDANGGYRMVIEETCAYYNVVQWDEDTYVSVGATSDSGTVKTPSWIQHSPPQAGQAPGEDKFWDHVEPGLAALRRLEAESLVALTNRIERGIPRTVQAHVPVPSGLPDDPVVIALDFLVRYKDLYQLHDPVSQLFLNRISTDDLGGRHLFFGQHELGVPVYGAELGIHLKDGHVTGTNGSLLVEIPDFRPPLVTDVGAEGIALSSVPGTETEVRGETKLMVFQPGLFGGDETETRLAWRVTIPGYRNSDGAATSWTSFVDAHSGEVLLNLDELRDAPAWPPKNFEVRDGGGRHVINCWLEWVMTGSGYEQQEAAPIWYTEEGPTPGYLIWIIAFGNDADADMAYINTHTIWDYFHGKFGWSSFRGLASAEPFEVIVHVDTSRLGALAYYSPMCKTFEFSDGWAVLDIMTHELTHAVTDNTARLAYIHQSGALNESYSNVFAVLVDDANWTIGEAGPGSTGQGLGMGPFRVYSDMVPCSADVDHGCVHSYDNIPSRAARLMGEGNVVDGIWLDGIGRDKLERLYWRVLTKELSSNATFHEARDKTVQVAREFASNSTHGFTGEDVCEVINAFAAVELGPRDLDCDDIYDYLDADDDGDYIYDGQDNCPTVANTDQENTDGDAQGDACDDDDDNDGMVDVWDPSPKVEGADPDGDGIGDSVDNCPNDNNPFQWDNDKDGIGDACDPDSDNDGIPDGGFDHACKSGETAGCNDNCRWDANPAQEDRDGDAVGDTCDTCGDTPDPTNADIDGDGKGNVCDEDMDNDGVLNDEDNCPEHRNPWQIDLDGDGRGTQCDPEELASLVDVEGLIEFGAEVEVRIPIQVCLQCPDWLPETYWTQVAVDLPLELPVRIVNDQGSVVSRAAPGLHADLGFKPDASYHYRPPGSLQVMGSSSELAEPYRGQGYWLEILPTSEVEPGKSYPIAIKVVSRNVALSSQYLPLVSRN